jgi:hypothetical protein
MYGMGSNGQVWAVPFFLVGVRDRKSEIGECKSVAKRFAWREIGKREKEIDAMREGNGMQGVSTQIHEKKKTVWDVIGKVKSSGRCCNILDVASCRWAFSEPVWEKRFTQPERCAVFGENGRRFLRVERY